MAAYRLAPGGGVTRTADGVHIPEDVRNRDWQTYLEWAAVPNTVDPIPLPDLDGYKAQAKGQVRANAESLAVAAGSPATAAAAYMLRLVEDEAALADADGTPTAGEYPLLDARADAESDTIANIADDVLAEKATRKTALTAIEAVALAAAVAIDAAADIGEVDDVVDAIVWP